MNKEDLTIKQRANNAGYEVRRVYRDDGSFLGMAAYKNGDRVHASPTLSAFGILELAEAAGY